MIVSTVVSLGLYAMGCALWPLQRPWLARGWALCGVLLGLLTSAYWVSDWFTGQGIDESVFYHLSVGLNGAGFSEYLSVMAMAGGLLLLSLLLGVGLWRLLQASWVRSFGWAAVSIALLAAAWGVNPGVLPLLKIGHRYALAAPTAELPPGYRQPTALTLAEGVQRPKNLVLIYAESLERTYFNEEVFPDLLPRLSGRQDQGLNFTHIEQLPGLGWTVAGMVGSQCGVPLGRSPEWTAEGEQSEFLPLATCLGDLLADSGYTLHYMGGAKSEFAGKGSFYRSHGYTRVEGRDTLSANLEDPDYLNPWGLYDDALLPMVSERFDELAQREAPFVLTTLTLDTHHPNGHVSASCEDQFYADGENPILQAVHCSDRLIDGLLEHILGSPYAEETLVVLMSDHMAMRNTASEILEQHPRRNLLLVMGDDIEPREVSRPGSHLDIAPTLLPLLGFNDNALGLGRDLLGEASTFPEQHQDSHEALRALYPSLGNLWAYPELAQGITVAPKQQQVMIGKRQLDYPVLLQVDADGNRVVGILQQRGFLWSLADLPEKTGFIWVDTCSRNALIESPPGSLCLVSRAPGGGPGQQRLLAVDGERIEPKALWQNPQSKPLPELTALVTNLTRGGRVVEQSQEGQRWLEAKAYSGRRFVRWQHLEGALQFSPRLEGRFAGRDGETRAEFDLAVAADSDAAAYRSAWVGAARVGEGALVEWLSPGDSVVSVAREAFWHDGVGAIDLRATGGKKPENMTRFIRHGEQTLLTPGRGLGVVVLDAQGEVIHRDTYDTHASEAASEALAERLQRLAPGHMVLLASGDEFTRGMTPALWRMLERLGFAIRSGG